LKASWVSSMVFMPPSSRMKVWGSATGQP
jgi:hypothetical protein